jgi:hypothetical protein
MVGRASSRRVVSVISPVLLSYRHQTRRERPTNAAHAPVQRIAHEALRRTRARTYLGHVEVDADEHALVGQHALRHIRERGLTNEADQVRAALDARLQAL